MEIASFFIDHFYLIEGYINEVKEGFEYLKEYLDKFNLTYVGGTEGNFLFVELGNKDNVNELTAKLKERDIYIRNGWPAPFDTGFAITGAPVKVMEKFVQGFLEVYSGIMS